MFPALCPSVVLIFSLNCLLARFLEAEVQQEGIGGRDLGQAVDIRAAAAAAATTLNAVLKGI